MRYVIYAITMLLGLIVLYPALIKLGKNLQAYLTREIKKK